MPATEMPTPKFQIGDEVFFATVQGGEEKHDCPDCLGEKVWRVTSPAGFEAQVECPRCHGRGHLSQHTADPCVRALTIGQVKIEWPTDDRSSRDEPVSYMCAETGIGSGSVYPESKLFTDREAAEKVAHLLALERREELDARDEKRAEFRHLSQYQLKDAAIKEAEDKAWKAARKYNSLLERICDLDEYPGGGSKFEDHPFVSLTRDQIRAVQNSLVWLDDEAVRVLEDYRQSEDA